MGEVVYGAIGLSTVIFCRFTEICDGSVDITCRCQRHNILSPIGQMPKKTTDKKPADKKDTGKKSNAGKDADDSKVRRLVLVGFDLGSMCER